MENRIAGVWVKAEKLINELFELMPYHIRPYNLGEQGRITGIIHKLKELSEKKLTEDESQPIPETKTDFQIAWELSQTTEKPFFIDTFRKLLGQYDNEDISLSKFVEELNVAAYKWKNQPIPVNQDDEINKLADFAHWINYNGVLPRITGFWSWKGANKPASSVDLAKRYLKLKEENLPMPCPIPVQEGLREREIAYKMLLGYYENTDGKFPDKETYDNFWDDSTVHPEKKEK